MFIKATVFVVWTDGWINLQIPGQPVVSWMHRLFVRQRKANVKVAMKHWNTQELSVNKKEGHSETWSKPSHTLPAENTPRILITIRYFQQAVPSQDTYWRKTVTAFCFWQKMQNSVEMLQSGVFSLSLQMNINPDIKLKRHRYGCLWSTEEERHRGVSRCEGVRTKAHLFGVCWTKRLRAR